MNVDLVHKEIVLACSPERAFALLTEHAGHWWPPDRRHLGDPESTIRMEATGRFFERARDGREAELGRVREWVPGERIALDFYVASGAERATDVLITLTPEGDGTRVTVTHRPGRAGDLWTQRAAAFERSWSAVLAAWQLASR